MTPPEGGRALEVPRSARGLIGALAVALVRPRAAVAARLARDLLKPGGFVTTLIPTGQQWDAPNGWPPLQWLAIEGVRRYGETALAHTARARWVARHPRPSRPPGRRRPPTPAPTPNPPPARSAR